MSRPRKLSEEQVQQVRNDWELFPEWTAEHIAKIHGVSVITIKRIVHDLPRKNKEPRPISLDTLNSAGVQIDQDKNVYGLKQPFFYAPLDLLPRQPEPEKYKMVRCPHCPQRMTARKLLRHCIDKHQRYDLEYLL